MITNFLMRNDSAQTVRRERTEDPRGNYIRPKTLRRLTGESKFRATCPYVRAIAVERAQLGMQASHFLVERFASLRQSAQHVGELLASICALLFGCDVGRIGS